MLFLYLLLTFSLALDFHVLLCFVSVTEGECPSHLVVLCRGRVFAFDAIHEGNMLTAPEISRFSDYLALNTLFCLSTY